MTGSGYVVTLPESLRDEVSALAVNAWPEECCGLLVANADDPTTITRFVVSSNIAADPLTTFEIDPQTLIATHRSVRDRGEVIAGCYHSHPNGDWQPSKTDLSRAEEAGFLWLIIATDKTGLAGYGLYRRMPEHSGDAGLRHFMRCEISET